MRRRRRSLLLCIALAALAAPPAGAQTDPAPVLAVLPFRVHSANPIDYLGESVANLLQERLAAGGELTVLDRAALRAALRDGLPPTADAELRRLAGDLGAGFVVAGSLTELAGRYSLDVRVVSVTAGARPHTQVMTAGDEQELLARVDELAERVAEHVLGAPPPRIARVELAGAGRLEDRLRGLLTLRPGEFYDPARIQSELAALRADPDVASVDVESVADPEGVIVRFRVVSAERLLGEPQATTGQRVAEVRVRGNRRIETDAIRARITTTAGEPYRPRQVANDLRAIHALSFFRDVRVFTEQTPAGLAVVFEVEENPVVRQISISGNDEIDDDKIRDVLTLTPGTTLDYPLLFENRERIKMLYRAQGYYLADVAYELETISEASIGVHFMVDEDEKLKLRRIEFVGNEVFSDGDLMEDFKTKRWRLWSYATSWFDKTGTYSEPLFRQDLASVEEKYANHGYLQVEIGEPQVDASQDGIEVVVPIVEGPQFRVGTIRIGGDEGADLSAVRSRLALGEGEIFNRSHLTADVARLRDHYTDRGFFYVDIEPLSRAEPTTNVIDVEYRVRKGPLYFVRQIDIAGNTYTVDPVIRREVPLVEGELYSQRKVSLAKTRIRGLGFFEEVEVNVEPTPDPEQLDLEVSVVERPTGSFSFGAGFSSQDSFLATGSLSQSNLFGRGYAVVLDASVSRRSQRFFFNFLDPSLLGSDFTLRLQGFRTQVRFEDFEQQATGGDVILGHPLSEDRRTAGHLRYSFSTAQVDQNTRRNAAAVIFRQVLQDSITTSLAGLSFTSDYRNDRLSPSDGYLLHGSVEYAGLGFFSNFARFELSASRYFPASFWILENAAFVLSTRLGWAVPLNSIGDFDIPALADADLVVRPDCNDDPMAGEQCRHLSRVDRELKLPLAERYFLGGIGSYQLRGFKARSIGPLRPILQPGGAAGTIYLTRGRDPDPTSPDFGKCIDPVTGLQDESLCNDITDKKLKDFENKRDTDVIGGNKFISSSIEYRFPIAETLGLQGILFIDMGNAFQEGESLYDVRDWRYGTGGAVRWFSPFGPIVLVLGFPIDRVSELEKAPVFEFSVGGG